MESYSVEAVRSAVDKNFTSSMSVADKSMNSLSQSANKTQTSVLDIAKGIGGFKLIDAGISLVKNSVSSAISRVDTLNNSARTFENMGFGKGETSKAMNDLKNSIQGLPTPLDSAVKGMTALSATYGDVSLGQKIFSSLNNAILGFGGSAAEVDNAIMQLSQLPMDGPLDAQTWNSLRNSGLTPVLSAMSKESGMSMSAMKEAFGKGQLTVKDFTDKLIEMNKNGGGGLKSLEKIAKDSTSGISTGISNMKTAVARGMANVIESINKALKNTDLKSIANIFSQIGTKIEGVLTTVSKVIPKIGQFFGDLFDTVAASGAHNIIASAWSNIIDVFKILIENIKPLINWFKSLWGTSDDVGGAVNGLSSIILVLAKTLNIITYALKAVVTGLSALKPLSPLLLPIVTTLAAFWVQLKGIGLVINTFMKIKSAITGVISTVKILFAIMAANPITIIIGLIAALVVGFIYFWNTSEDFRNFWIGLWEGIKKAVDTAVKGIQSAWNATVKWFTDTWNNIKNGAKGLWDGTIQGAKDAVDSVKNAWNGIKEWFANLWKGTTSGLASAWDSVTTTLAPFVETIKTIFQPMLDFFSGLWGQVQTIFGSAWEIIKTVVMGPVLLLIDLITGDFNQFKKDFGMLWQTLATAIQTIVQTFVNIVVGFYSSFFQTVVNIWTTIVNTIQSLWGAFTTWVVNMAKSIVDGIVNGWNSFKQGTVDLWNATIQWIKDTWASFKQWVVDSANAIVNGVKQGWKNLKQGTIDLWKGMINGLKGIWDGLKQSVSDLIDNVKTTFNNLKNINLLDIGKAIIDGFVKGLKQKWEDGMKFISGIGDWIREHKGPIRVDRKLLTPAGNAIMNGLNSGLTGGFRDVQSNVSGMGDMIANAINSDYSVDIGANVAAANRSISSQVSHDVNLNQGKQPASFTVKLGNQNFKAFVDDISNAQGQAINLNMGF